MKITPKIAQYVIASFLLLPFLINLDIHAQQEQISWNEHPVLKENISTDPDEPIWVQYFYFHGASYPNGRTKLPYYEKIINTGEDQIQSAKLLNVTFDTLKLNDFTGIKGVHSVDTSLTLSIKEIYIRKKQAARLSFVPIIKRGQDVLLVTSFQFEVHKSNINKNAKVTSAYSDLETQTSVLGSGNWYNIRLNETGIYKITYQELVDLGVSNPANVRVYGNVGGQLPFNTSDNRISGLKENPIYMHTGGDGNFGSGDYILFYGEGPNTWKYNQSSEMFLHHIHDYSSYSYYFVTSDLGAGKRIETAEEITDSPEVSYNNYVYFDHYEEDERNLIGSGRQWVELMINNQKDVTFTIPDIVTSKKVKVKSRMVGRSSTYTSFSVYHGSTKIDDVGVGAVNIKSHEGYYGKSGILNEAITPTSASVPIRVRYNRITGDDKGYLDYITINGYRKLQLINQPLLFRQIPNADTTVVSYEIDNATDQTIVWDVTHPHYIAQLPTNYSAGKASFISLENNTKEYVAFDLNHSFLSPEFMEEMVPNQDLFGMEPVEYIIIAHPDFINQANELAELHRTKSGLSVAVVQPQQIYNDFSSGAPDVSAIRDFLKWIYEKDQSDDPTLKYVLLFGDGSYANKDTKEDSPNFVLTYQSSESLHQTQSFVGDDFYAFLDPNEGDVGGTMDIGIGRLTVRTQAEAEHVLNKIKQYLNVTTMGPWRNRLCFVGDDEDNNIHMDQANDLTVKLNQNHPQFQLQKIYLDAYKQQVSANGTNYPEAEKSIFDALENGLLVFNYTGHGSEESLAHERLILKSDIQNWSNAPYYPLFITATCEFSRFDADNTTAGEFVLLNEKGGGIALLTTTRLVYSRDNFNLNNSFYDYAFRLDEDGNKYRLGDVLRFSKNAISGLNKRNFSLLGDPALALNYPLYQVQTDSINNISVTERADTISAFSQVSVSGCVVDFNGSIIEDFSGSVYPVIFDKEQEVTTFNNDNESAGPYSFKVRNNIIYKGKASVNNGRFNFQFRVPKDIGYSIGQGKIVYYAENKDVDAHGFDTAIYIGGTPKELIIDNTGPEIDLYLNDSNFVVGGITDANPRLFAKISDESGINATGAGIGHDIVAYLNGNTKEIFVLNEFYETSQDNFRSGTITYPLQNLEPGYHTLTLKVWDIINNSSEQTIEFQVLANSDPVLKNVYNYPNPFSGTTHFNVEHNLAGQDLVVIIEIFDVSGRLIRKIENNIYSGGYRLAPIEWDGTNGSGEFLDAGVYPYRITVQTNDGNSVQKFSKLILQ